MKTIDSDILERYRVARDAADILLQANNARAKSHGSSHNSGAYVTPSNVVDCVLLWKGLAVEIADAVALAAEPVMVHANKTAREYRCQRCGTSERIPVPVHCLDCERAIRAEMSEVT